MKRTLTAVATASMVLGTLVPMAFASTTSAPVWSKKTITVGTYTASPDGYAANNSGNMTTYMPLYYVLQGLKSLGYTVTWDGSNLKVTTPSSVKPNVSNVSAGTGSVKIFLNGTQVGSTDMGAYKDPLGGPNAALTAYFPIYYIQNLLSRSQVQNTWNGTSFALTQTTGLSLKGSAGASVAVGQTNNFSVSLSDASGTAMTASGVTYSVTDANGNSTTGAVIGTAGNFIASAAGTYVVTASANGMSATQTVTVYGQAAAMKLSAASASLVANSAATDTITATIVDANGNTVTNFNGTATLAGAAHGTFTDVTSGATITSATFTNGVAKFNVEAGNTASVSDTITMNTLASTNSQTLASGFNYGNTVINYVAATASAVSLTPTTSTVSANTSSLDQVAVKINDSTGTALGSGAAQYVTFTLSGPGSFQQGGTPVTTLSEYVTPGTSVNVSVYSVQGQTGTITITGSASGLTSGTATIKSVVTGTASAFTVSSAAGTVNATGHAQANTLAVGTPFTLYTVQLTDASGNAIVPATNDNLTVSDNTSTTGGTLDYFAVSNGQPSGAAATAATLGATIAAGGSTPGEAQFAVVNTTVGTSNPTITITDALTATTKTSAYTFSTGSAAYALFPADSAGALTNAASYAEAGQSATYTVQLQDASGNNLTTSGQNVDFYFDGATNTASATINSSTAWTAGAPYVATTNAQGQASVTVAIPATSATEAYTLDAVVAGQSGIAKNAVTVEAASGYTTQLNLAAAANGTAALTWPATNINGGQTLVNYLVGSNAGLLNVFVTPENAVAGYTSTTDQLEITTSNSKVLAITAGGGWTAVNGSSTTFLGTTGIALPTITAGQSGTATLTITDVSNPASPKITENFTVAAGTPIDVKGLNPDGTYDTAYTYATSGVVGPFTLELVDAGGNAVPATAPTTLTAAQAEAALGVSGVSGVRLSSSGTDASSVTIAQNQSSVQVWVDGVTSGNKTTATAMTALSAEAPVFTSYSVTGSTLTLTANNPLNGLSAANLTTLAGQFAVTNNGAGDVVTAASVSGNTVTLTLTTAPAHGNAVTVAYTSTGLLTDGYTAAIATFAATPVTNNN